MTAPIPAWRSVPGSRPHWVAEPNKESVMLSRTHLTIAVALAILAIGAPAATARDTSDARGEHAASLSGTTAAPDSPTGDRRTPDAVEPFVRPVVVEVGDPVTPGFDWVAAIIGLAGGLAFAVLAGA